MIEDKVIPKIIENYSSVGIDVARIVSRIMSSQSPNVLDGLQEVWLLNTHPRGFASYKYNEGIIELYVSDLLGSFSPLMLKIFYPFSYAVIGMAVAHELDHHVNRKNTQNDKEAVAEANVMKYIYPSLGIWRPIVQMIAIMMRPFQKLQNKTNELKDG